MSEPILHQLRTTPGVNWAEPVGSLRRGQDLVDGIGFLASTNNAAAVLEALGALADGTHVPQSRSQQIDLVVDGVPVGIHHQVPETAGALLLQLTGSGVHVDRLRRLASDRGFVLDAEGLRSADTPRIVASTEDDIYAALGLPFIAPELRDDDEAIEAALAGRLPSLVSRADIRGDLHMHTHWSDGRDSIEAMVAECIALGYEYLAITDHSTHSAASRNLSHDDVERQSDEIAALRERYPQMAIFHGAEVDILPNGQLDFPDRLLCRFDIVLASLHDRASHSPRELFRRYEAAMRHPLVAIVTHPMNRPGPGRPGYDFDVDRLFELAVETGTVLEIDGAPSHLDLEAPLARRAVEAGVLLSIDSDAHRTEMLERNMTLGLLTARRGWVEARSVVNTRSRVELNDFLVQKRAC
jgi:DNA polymerase (family X)